MARSIMAASAIAPCISYKSAMAKISEGLQDPMLGNISIAEVQLCPQHAGALSEGLADELMEAYPNTRFRLHASPRVRGGHRHQILSAANAFEHPEQLEATAAINKRLGADGYSIHAGSAREGTLDQAIGNTNRLADRFGCRVGIEGLYPARSREEHWLLSTWADYEAMLAAEVDFALDLSHLFIVSRRSSAVREDLVAEMLRSPHCMEVHVSANNGHADAHLPLTSRSNEWWLPLLSEAHEYAAIFYEGVLLPPK